MNIIKFIKKPSNKFQKNNFNKIPAQKYISIDKMDTFHGQLNHETCTKTNDTKSSQQFIGSYYSSSIYSKTVVVDKY